MPDPTPQSDAFRRNAQAALKDGTFEDVLTALVMKLQERGVFDEEAAEKARRVNEPLARAFLRPRDQEARDRAWDDLSARILQLGGLLPPEDADGAFLADRTRVEEIVEKRKTLYAQKAVQEMRQRREADQRRADGHDDDDEARDFNAGSFEGDIFQGLGERSAFFSGLYKSGHAPTHRPGSPSAEGAAQDRTTGATEELQSGEGEAPGD